jgi:hypothetical protein
VKALLEKRLARRGSTACVGLVPLAAIEAEFRRFEIRTSVATTVLPQAALFARSVPGFDAMPDAVKAAHVPEPAIDLLGEVETHGPETWVGRIIGWFAGFPAKSGSSTAAVTIERDGEGEVWIRRFGAASFKSHLSDGQPGRLSERFGFVTIDLDAKADAQGFSLAVAQARLGELPLPRFLTPDTRASAFADEQGRYRFDVTITMPLAGRLVRYQGWLRSAQKLRSRSSAKIAP